MEEANAHATVAQVPRITLSLCMCHVLFTIRRCWWGAHFLIAYDASMRSYLPVEGFDS